MKWVKERDLLIAQTMAFVQSVTGKRPDFTASPIAREAAPIETPPPLPTPAPAEASIEPAAVVESAAPADLTPRDSTPPNLTPTEPLQTVVLAPPARALPQNDVRKEIQSRVAAFQAHQHRFQREREDYFKSVLIKVRSAIENGPETPAT